MRLVRWMSGCVLAAMPVAAAAQTVEVYGGLAVTSDYISSGLTNSDHKPALQGYVEFDASGFYGGVWVSSVAGFGDNVELDLYLGYRNELASGLSYDLSYYRYVYDNSGDCCGEIILALGLPVGDSLTISPELAWDPETDATSGSVTIDVALGDNFGLALEAGSIKDAQDYYRVGASYTLGELTTLDLSYHDSDVDDGRVALTLSYDTTLFSR